MIDIRNVTKEDVLKDLEEYEHRCLENKELVFSGRVAKLIPFVIFEGEYGRSMVVFNFVKKKWDSWDNWAKIRSLENDLAGLDHIEILWNYMAYGMLPGIPEDPDQLVGIKVEVLDSKEKLDEFIEKMTKRSEIRVSD